MRVLGFSILAAFFVQVTFVDLAFAWNPFRLLAEPLVDHGICNTDKSVAIKIYNEKALGKSRSELMADARKKYGRSNVDQNAYARDTMIIDRVYRSNYSSEEVAGEEAYRECKVVMEIYRQQKANR